MEKGSLAALDAQGTYLYLSEAILSMFVMISIRTSPQSYFTQGAQIEKKTELVYITQTMRTRSVVLFA